MNPMVEQVNRIVYNLLAGEHSVHIPSVGSLVAVHRPAKRLSKHQVTPPSYEVTFTSQTVGTSLTDAVARAAGCEESAAQQVVQRWLAYAMQGETLTIEGVGILHQKSFAIDPSFDKVLNPRGHAPITIYSGQRHWLFWTLASVAIACGLGVCGWVLYDRMAEERLFTPETTPVEVTVAKPAPAEPALPADTTTHPLVAENLPDSVAGADLQPSMEPTPSTEPTPSQPSAPEVSEPAGATTVAPPASKPQLDNGIFTPRSMIPGRHYVVLGVFSSEQNAGRAVKKALADDPALHCGVWVFGQKFMATMYDSADADACASFAKVQTGRFPDTWVYTAK